MRSPVWLVARSDDGCVAITFSRDELINSQRATIFCDPYETLRSHARGIINIDAVEVA